MLASLRLIENFISLPKQDKTYSVLEKTFTQKIYDAQLLADALTTQGFEVESITHRGAGLETVVVGRILSCEPHPDANRLQVCSVDVGEGSPRQIVCGAKNARANLYVAVALPGTKLSAELEIKPAEVRGVQSLGMLCSRGELQLQTQERLDGDGIWEISEDIQGGKSIQELQEKIGTPIFEALELSDVLLDISVTPNRPDMLCHFGVAREIAVALTYRNIPFSKKEEKKFSVSAEKILQDAKENASHLFENKTTVEFVNYLNRPAFFMILNHLVVSHSPPWLRNTLETLGHDTINNVVDISNYVLHMYGQPNHAFDLHKLHVENDTMQFVLRNAKPQETFPGLDGKTRELHEKDCVGFDGKDVQTLLGVLGGDLSKVTEGTTALAVEFANPDPVSVRRSSRRHGKQSDSSFAFEKGIDTQRRFFAAALFHQMISDLCGDEVSYETSLHSKNLESFPIFDGNFETRILPLTADDQKRILGCDIIGFDAQVNILHSLGFDITEKTEKSALIGVPSWRMQDIDGTADLIEEVVRVVGIDHVKPLPLRDDLAPGKNDAHFEIIEKINRQMVSLGYNEIISLHFMRADDYAKLNHKSVAQLGEPIALINPIIGDEPLLHNTLIPDLLRKVSKNLNHSEKSGQMFHVCRTYQNQNAKSEKLFSSMKKEPTNLFQISTDYAPESGYPFSFEPGADESRPVESLRMAGVCFGNKEEKSWANQKPAPWTFYDVLGHVRDLFFDLGIAFRFQEMLETSHSYAASLHPKKRVIFTVKNPQTQAEIILGWAGEFHPQVCRNYDIEGSCFGFEFNVGLLMKNRATETHKLPKVPTHKFPAIERDFALIFQEDVSNKALVESVHECLTPLLVGDMKATLEHVHVFDIFRGGHVGEGRKSVTFQIKVRPEEKTFLDAQIQKIYATVVDYVSQKLNADMRLTAE